MRSTLATMPLASALAVGQAATVYTESCKFDRCVGDAAIRLSTTAGTIAVSQQCSKDDRTWYDPYKTVSGTTSEAGVVEADQGVTTGVYITYSPVIANYIRFKIVEANSAPTVVTLDLIFREEM